MSGDRGNRLGARGKQVEGAVLCAFCFRDRGLRILAARFGGPVGPCRCCGLASATLLDRDALLALSHEFFVRGSEIATDFGGAPAIVFNYEQEGTLEPGPDLAADVQLLQGALGVGFFHYGPRLWMIGQIDPLQEMLDAATRIEAIQRVIGAYPVRVLEPVDEFFRVRRAPASPADASEYDAPPPTVSRDYGRLDDGDLVVMYGSQDLDICIHESRFAAGDELYVATLAPARPLRLLDLGAVLQEEATEFERVDLAIMMLFLAGRHAYPVTRSIASAVREAGFDGIAYPSFFSQLQTGGNLFETVYGLALRRLDGFADREQAKVVRNFALFGRPIEEGAVGVVGINRLRITRVSYGTTLGPVVY